MPNRSSPLTPRQRRFVQNFLDNPNPGEAARLAGYTQNRASGAGQRLLNNPIIAGEIRMRTKTRREISPVDGARVIDAIARIAFEGQAEQSRLRALDRLALYLRLYGPRAPAAAPEPSRFTEENYAKARAALKERVAKILAERDDNAAAIAVFDTGVPM